MSTAAISKSTSRAWGVVEGSRASPVSVATQRPAAPSVSGELLPAVIVPCARSNAGRREESFSSDVSRRGNWSRSRPSTATRSCGKPASWAAIARRWLSRAYSSCSRRPIFHSFAISSQCSPMLLPVARFLISGT